MFISMKLFEILLDVCLDLDYEDLHQILYPANDDVIVTI